ncbi:MAG: nucleoside-diphosphate kinase [Patescibacteria group bacterium]
MSRTFVMIKPNAVKAGLIGQIIHFYELARLKVVGIKIVKMTSEKAGLFYKVHKERRFFPELTKSMSSGPSVLIVLEGENAVSIARQLNGATDPAEALPGTIRYIFADNKAENVVHSSDSLENAMEEISFWFSPEEIVVQQFSPDFRVE